MHIGFWGVLAVALLGVWGCGRERVNPIDPNFPGNEGLSTPGNLRAAGDIGRIILTWNPVTSTSLAGYGVWRSTSATGTYVRLSGEVADSLITTARITFVDTTLDLKVAKIYFYKVNTVDNQKRSSELSVLVSAEALEDNRPPGPPAALSVVTDVETGHVTLTWTAPQTDVNNQELTGLDAYRIFRAKDTQDAFVQIGTAPAGQATYKDTSDLEVDTRYFYSVSALDGAENESGRSASASVTTTDSGVDVPGGLRVIGTIGQIVVTWTAVTDPNLIGYLVLRSASTQEVFQSVTADTLFTTAQTEYIDTDVEPDRVYFYRVQAVIQDPSRGVVRSTESPFVDGKATIDQIPPAAPSDLIVSLGGTDVRTVQLNWSAPLKDSNGGDLTGLETYRIFRSEGNNTSFALLAEVPGAQTSYEDRNTELLTQYFYTVSAVDDNDNVSARSTTVPITTGGLAVPKGLHATPGIGWLVLVWSANTESDLIGYKVLRSDRSGGPFTFLQGEESEAFTTAQTAYVDSSLVADQVFFYRLIAVGRNGVQSDTSAFVTGTTRRMAAPGNVTATGDVNQITISWAANTELELTGYRVLRYTDPSQTAPEATFNTVRTAYVDSPLVAGQTYVYRVQAVGAGGLLEGELSQFVSEEVPADNRAPATPGVFSGRLVSSDAIELTWAAPKTDTGGSELTGLSRFRLYRAVGTGGAGFYLFTQVDSTLRIYRDRGLEMATTYAYRISALDGHGNESVLSNSITLTTSSAMPPTNVRANLVIAGADTLVRVTWTAPAEFTNFRVERQTVGTSSGSDFKTVSLAQTETTFEDSGVEPGKSYLYRVLTNLKGVLSEASTAVGVSLPAIEE